MQLCDSRNPMTLTLPTLRSLCLGIDIAEKIGVYRAVVNREESGGGGRGVGPRLLPCSAAWALSPGFWPFEVFGSGIFPSSECYLRQNMGCQQGQQPAQQPAAASGNLGLGTWQQQRSSSSSSSSSSSYLLILLLLLLFMPLFLHVSLR